MSKVVIVGGHGNVSLRLARLLSAKPNYKITSLIRNAGQSEDITSTGASPFVISLEDDPKEKFADVFQGSDIVYFSAGAGGNGGPERTKKVDYEGALKVFDAIELVKGDKPRLILVSAIDIRNPDVIPAHYNDEDKAISERMRKAIPTYVDYKYKADKNLVLRNAFKWTILRPGGLSNEPGTGKASIGRTHLSPTISRDDVALALAVLAEKPEAAGLAVDLVGGDEDIQEGLDRFVKKGETDWLG